MPQLISVAVPVPFVDLLTYQVPDALARPVRGARVLVPLGSRVLTGIVVNTDAPAGESPAALKAVVDVLDEEPFLPETIVDLTSWVAEYYACGAGEAMAVALPPKALVHSDRSVRITASGLEWLAARTGVQATGLKARILEALGAGRPVSLAALAARLRKTGEEEGRGLPVSATARSLERDGLVEGSQPLRGRASAHLSVRVVTVTAEGLDSQVALGSRQREALDLLRGAGDGLALPALTERGVSADTVERLLARGLVSVRRKRVERDPFATVQGGWDTGPPDAARILTGEQILAFDTLKERALSGRFSAALLHGVTGSGKTEVYLRLAEVVRAAGRSVLVLVPEIALTPAVAAAFRAAFGDSVAIQHSGLSDGERYDQWQRIRRGEVSVVVGTRSAVFAPLASPGLIVVDEEHDGSFKQEEAPRTTGVTWR